MPLLAYSEAGEPLVAPLMSDDQWVRLRASKDRDARPGIWHRVTANTECCSDCRDLAIGAASPTIVGTTSETAMARTRYLVAAILVAFAGLLPLPSRKILRRHTGTAGDLLSIGCPGCVWSLFVYGFFNAG